MAPVSTMDCSMTGSLPPSTITGVSTTGVTTSVRFWITSGFFSGTILRSSITGTGSGRTFFS